MRFESMQISNYRQYQSMEMNFEKTKETDLHVVVASNGVGKTNLLNAIQWCLYGEEPHLGDKDEALTICNHAGLVEARQAGQDKAIVSVKIHTTAQNRKIVFERTQAVQVSSFFEDEDEFKIAITEETGETVYKEGVEADELVEQYFPSRIKQYFFFDGEQLFNYFGKGQDTTHVKDSIHEIAQINIVSKCRENLDKIIGEYRKTISQLVPKGEGISNKIAETQAKKQGLDADIIALEESIKESEAMITELSQKISGVGHLVEFNTQYEKNKLELAQLEKEKERIHAELLAFIRKYYVLLMMYEFNDSTDTFIKEKLQKGSLPPAIDKKMIMDSLDQHECVLCKSHITEEREVFLHELIKKFEVSTTASHNLMEIKNNVINFKQEASNYMRIRDNLFARMKENEERIETLTTENENLNKKLRSCSSLEYVGEWVSQRKEYEELCNTNREKIGGYKEQSRALGEEIISLNEQFAQSISDDEKCQEYKMYLDFATEAYNIVNSIEKEVVSEVRTRMEEETMELFSNLIWKKNTYGRIELNENYKLKIFHKHTGESMLGSCSAAEREMLALAFTIALHRVSNHDCLLFIDTPVGRVSDTNRENFAKSLVAVSKYKQLILAFTPSEYSDEIRRYFNSNVVSSFSRMNSYDEVATYKEG